MAADGLANTAIAQALSVSPASVSGWRVRFAEEGLVKFAQVRQGRGRKKSIPQETIDEIVDLTLNYRPQGETQWSCRTMAAATGVSKSTVQQVWSARGLKPHRVETFKLSNDPKFEDKLVDVVGLYLHPPEKAIVLCADEKSSVQALDRTQASLPMVKGHGETTNSCISFGVGSTIGRGRSKFGRGAPRPHRGDEPRRGVLAVGTHNTGRPPVTATRAPEM